MQQELVELVESYGEPLRQDIHLGDNTYLQDTRWRVAEVCMVVRRPGGLVTVTKPFYPGDIFRLPTGGVEPRESLREALEREIWEELGVETRLVRFLAHLTYHHNGGRIFHTYAFLLEGDGGTLAANDPAERVGGYREIAPAELSAIADRLEALPAEPSPELGGLQSDWGRFRAPVHRAVAQALSAQG